ncbi:class I SAM-dependent methyltransferase [Hahella ganghwensis]|uniref:class I SAM-dependent methyltransferase n=1 Tax=Hahella ganghwensis TaxID=286420 RepID=UPI00036646E5|nr:class I SAM-dependent methyltransferase [Hahella ganghwensis]
MTREEIESRLKELSPETPWAHLYEFVPGLFSVTPESEQFYKKATGLNRIGEALLQIAETQVYGHSLEGKRVLDLACGEGRHSVMFAERGAQVMGVEGRKLYVDRAKFAAGAVGQPQIEFIQGDVRKLDPELGVFDVVIFSGILHHLGIDDFDAMVRELGRLTTDMLLIYTHVSSDLSIKRHNLKGPVKTEAGREGYLFREHKDNATDHQKESQVRASLDNTFSFWAKEEVLINSLRSAGFPVILKVMSPHVLGWENASYRPILVAKKAKIEVHQR